MTPQRPHPTEPARFRCRAVIFDLDGTLADTVPDLAVAVDRTLADLALPPAGEERVRTWVGNGAKVLLERALQQAGAPTLLEQALALFFRHYGSEFTARSRLYPGVGDTLSQLAARGLRLAVCTNKPSRFVRPLLLHFGIERHFAAVAGGDDLPVKKPDPAPLHHLARTLALSSGECLVVGDSRTDVAAARAAGMAVAAVRYGYNHGEPIDDSRPDAAVDAFGELTALIA
jgi:phosphoglycolate phosphatase